MKHINLLLVGLTLLLFACNTQKQKTEHTSAPPSMDIPNGLYLVINEYSDPVKADPFRTFVEYSHDFLESNTKNQPVYLEIVTTEYVPLNLTAEPVGIVQPDKRINLMLSLTPVASKKLSSFTEKHLNGKVAIVIGGQAVTKHKVRTKIDGGKLQITRCTDDACKFLLLELKESIE